MRRAETALQLYWLLLCAVLMATAALMATTMCVGEAVEKREEEKKYGGVESKKAKLPFMLRDGADVGVMRSHGASWQATIFASFGFKNVNDFKGEYIVWLVLKVERRLKVPRFP